MNPTEIEFAVKDLVAKPYDAAAFVFDLIGIYNTPKITVSKLKSGQTNAATSRGDVVWKKRLFFRSAAPSDDVAAIADALVNDPLTAKHKPRFIFVANGDRVHIRDLALDDTCNTEFTRLDESSDFLLPLAGFERRAGVTENPADVKAAKRLAKLYDAILAANPTWSDGNHTHELNLFMMRVLFCFYAEDTGLFGIPQLFTQTVAQHTNENGGDVAALLERLFLVMNLKEGERLPTSSAVDNRFPYVNGSLFETKVAIPSFNRTARRLLLECAGLDWQTINPDIFGSMIQTIAEPGARGDLGLHYTSVPNILKVLQPLFLDDLNDAYEGAKDRVSNLEALLVRLSKLRVFDPACGSGNFLITAYKQLRRIEMRILERIGELSSDNPLRLSGISLHNFFGIDIVDFACETAKLSLWIAEYQMNMKFKEVFGSAPPPLPLGKIATIHCRNSIRLNWLDVCPADENTETYLCGNPPYVGSKYQSPDHKSDMAFLFGPLRLAFKKIDYVCCFFLKAAEYLNGTAGVSAFVSTNSICQGEQVAILWPILYDRKVDIVFAYSPFKWQNNASHNAGVSCVIVALAPSNSARQRTLYTGEHVQYVSSIGPYLIPGSTLIVEPAPEPINGLPKIIRGNMSLDDGHLVLSPSEMRRLISQYPGGRAFVRRYMGSEEFINHIERYCLWIADEDLQAALSIPAIAQRIDAVRRFRLASTASSTRDYASVPYRFRETNISNKPSIIVPTTTSDRRRYITVGLVDGDVVINVNAFALQNPPGHMLAILSSRLLRIWMATVGGKMKNDARYSSTLVYNTFPIPDLSDAQKLVIADHSRAILKARARHPGKTIAWLYNPETMPGNVLQAHHDSDTYFEEVVYGREFRDDTQRLERLFAMYGTMKARAGMPLLAAPSKKSRA